MKLTNSINVKSFKVKPIVAAIALVGMSATVDAQPIVSVGGSFNASAAASVSSSFPSLNANKSMNFGYSGTMDVNHPHNTDAVGSVIADIGSDSKFSQSLPGLDAPQQGSSAEQPNASGAASLVSDSASEATATLNGGPSAPSGQVIASAANQTASEASATVNGAQNPTPDTDSGDDGQESDSGDDMAATQDSLPETDNDDAGMHASAVGEAASSVSGRADSSPTPSMDLFGAISGSAIAEASGYVSGLEGDTPTLDVSGSALTEAAAQAEAHIEDARAQEPDSVADNGQETDGDDAADSESPSEEVADSGETLPESDQGTAEPQGSEVAASAEQHSQADAFATLYR